MEGAQAIIERIIKDAEAKAEFYISDARKKAADDTAKAQEWANLYIDSQKDGVKKESEGIISRRVTVAGIDAKKTVLSKKQAVIDGVLEKVYGMLCGMKKSDYAAFVDKLIEENAEEGDTVILSKDGVLTKKDISALPSVARYKLAVADKSGDFIGGVYLSGEKSDKDITFRAVIDDKKEDLSAYIAQSLFGD